ncbi:hypothetical protein SPRG_13866 [Saprolegnia parasitica CBS 223.65]|uniref:FYVE-type domain-containing protein n=1 Tax=Saprolegnia parasitica (strain CBS 223.65) TaxID=695850 RepID=A0A067BS39_SAPPC|nr:hypothetical protein SPRG_13866 [Saprolegnia parasitica CBS 223.65]KDO21073.1 hypothetical protein SPRG_13866 [Saprolegnia parasitica CBS 223.65]|eukprot:XP_012208252.1 hypothetical protein SPRG_13866 [Saprolegnia parasitica CBS 223.65]
MFGGHKRHGYPVRDDFLPCNSLPSTRKAELATFGASAFDTFVQKAVVGDRSIAWNLIDDTVDQIKLYEGRVAFLDKHGLPYLATTTFAGELATIAGLHGATTHADCVAFIRSYAPDVLDMVVLEMFHEAPRPMTLKWSAVASPWPLTISDRDFVYLEISDYFHLPDGRRGWGYCQVSVELDHVPSLQASSLKLVRGVLCHTGCLYIESMVDDGCVDVIYHIASDFRGRIPYWARKHGIKSRVRQLLLLSATAREDAAKRKQTTCSLCEKAGSRLFRRLRQCDGCSEMVCPKCREKWVHADGSSRRLCTYCSCTDRSTSSVRVSRRTQGTASSTSLPTPPKSYSQRHMPAMDSLRGQGQRSSFSKSEMDLSYLGAYRKAPPPTAPARQILSLGL